MVGGLFSLVVVGGGLEGSGEIGGSLRRGEGGRGGERGRQSASPATDEAAISAQCCNC